MDHHRLRRKHIATRDHWQALLAGPLAVKPVRQIIVSHNHVDHIGYAALLAAITGAEVIMGSAEHDRTIHMLEMAGPKFGASLRSQTYNHVMVLIKMPWPWREQTMTAALSRLCRRSVD